MYYIAQSSSTQHPLNLQNTPIESNLIGFFGILVFVAGVIGVWYKQDKAISLLAADVRAINKDRDEEKLKFHKFITSVENGLTEIRNLSSQIELVKLQVVHLSDSIEKESTIRDRSTEIITAKLESLQSAISQSDRMLTKMSVSGDYGKACTKTKPAES